MAVVGINEMIRYPVVDTSENMEIRGDENKVYVAVGKEMNESVLRWALRNSGGAQIGLLHVHQPAEKIKLMGTNYPINQLDPNLVAIIHETDTQDMHKLLNKYKQICQKAGVCSEVHYIEMSSIEKGIVALILEHNVRRLVMGAAADKYYSRRMVDLRSRTAIYVRLQADPSCHIQFICKDEVIFTRWGKIVLVRQVGWTCFSSASRIPESCLTLLGPEYPVD
ncbi:U-box domain-containing protein kinase family protein [Tanacetum coccineum]